MDVEIWVNGDILKRAYITVVWKRIKVDKSLGPGEVYPRMLREAGEKKIAQEDAGRYIVLLMARHKVPKDWVIF